MELFLSLKKRSILLLFPFIFIGIRCTTEGEKSCSTDDIQLKESSVNPNGDSELALLMREMFDSTAVVKALLADGKSLNSCINNFKLIHTAIPTDVSVKNETFEVMATDYLKSVDKLYAAATDQQKEYYEVLVQKCINCHQVFCPGPIRKINKLKI